MMKEYLLLIGLFTEGKTDERFLPGIVERTLDQWLLDPNSSYFDPQISMQYKVILLEIKKTGLGFTEQVLEVSKKAKESGCDVICVHTDADDKTPQNVLNNKINPAKRHLHQQNAQHHCILLTPIIPVYMTESWMLADLELLKRQLLGPKDSNLKLNQFIEQNLRKPEQISDPKKAIEEAIQLVEKTRPNDNVAKIYKLLTYIQFSANNSTWKN